MKKLIYLSIISLFVIACSNNSSDSTTDTASTDTATSSGSTTETAAEYDERLGTGKYNEENVPVSESVDPQMVNNGTAIYGAKCQSCHKLTDEQLVGPGFKGVSERRTPVWLMNFLTNTDEMIDVDPALQEQLEVCMVRMPDQALGEGDAVALVNFFKSNDAN